MHDHYLLFNLRMSKIIFLNVIDSSKVSHILFTQIFVCVYVGAFSSLCKYLDPAEHYPPRSQTGDLCQSWPYLRRLCETGELRGQHSLQAVGVVSFPLFCHIHILIAWFYRLLSVQPHYVGFCFADVHPQWRQISQVALMIFFGLWMKVAGHQDDSRESGRVILLVLSFFESLQPDCMGWWYLFVTPSRTQGVAISICLSLQW